MVRNDNILCFDIGNTRIKALLNGKYHYFKSSDFARIDEFVDSLTVDDKAVLSSVNLQSEKYLRSVLTNKGIKSVDAKLLIDRTMDFDFSLVPQMGSDRRLGLIGGTLLAEPPLAVVDCGTAVTVNLISVGNIIEGGAIFPGFHTQARALNEFTSLLPLVPIEYEGNPIGRTTIQAIQSGLFHSVAGGVGSLVSDYFAIYPNMSIVLTGGYSEMLLQSLEKYKLIHEKNLILLAIHSLASKFFL